MKRTWLALALVLLSTPAWAQQEIDATKVYIGTATITGSGTAIVLSGLSVTGSTALQTVTSGTWQGSAVGLLYGGTGASLTASQGGILYSGASAAAILAGTATAGQMLQSGASAAPAWSATTWPSAVTSGRVLFATGANAIGEDADLSFSTDTLTATKLIAPTSVATPTVFANSSGSLSLGGTGVGGCATNPPTAGNCEATGITITTPYVEQRLSTSTSTRSRWYIGADGGHVAAYGASAWLPLKLDGGPVEIGGGGLHVGSVSVSDPGLGNAVLDGYIGAPTYASQTTGWRITGDGSADFRYLYTDELHAKKFIADLEQALAGGQIIAKSVGQVGATFTVPAKGSISVLTMRDLPSAANMAIFEAGDWIRVRNFSRSGGELSITDAWGTVSGYADAADGLQTWNFTRALGDDGGAMSTGATVEPDAIVLDYGVSGNGFHEVNAADGLRAVNSPYSQIVTWSGSSPRAANQTVRTRLGNLKGITGQAEWGLLAGTYGTGSTGKYVLFSDLSAEIHNVPLSLYSGSTRAMYADPLTPYWSMGNPAPTSYSSGTGMWSGLDAGTYKWRVGAPGGQGIDWNGTTLTITGDVVIQGTIPDASNAAALGGVAASVFIAAKDRTNLGLNSSGNPTLPAVAAPSGAGLYLSSNRMGYYNGSAWRTYLDNSGNFYLSGSGSNGLSWDGSNLAVAGSITITGGSGYANLSDKPTLGALAALNSVAWSTQITGIPETLGTPTGTGLFLTSTALGYYTGATWMTYMDNAGRFYLGGTSGKLKWDGAALSIEGTITSTAGTIGGWSLGASTLADASGVVGLSSAVTGGDDIRLWAGSATPSAAPFQLTESGSLTATNATLSGTLQIGADAYMSGVGFWVAPNGGTPQMRIGDPSGAYLRWTGSALEVSDSDADVEIWPPNTLYIGRSGGAAKIRVAIGSTTGAYLPLVQGPSRYATVKTDGVNETSCTGSDIVGSLTVEYGIVTGVTCVADARPELVALQRDVADLRQQLAALAASGVKQ